MKILTEQRNNYWIAYIENNSGYWEAGRTEVEAIGKLVKILNAESSDWDIVIVRKEK